MLKLSQLATMYVKVPVAGTENGAAIDPTGDTVELAFVDQYAQPASGDWQTASWEVAGSDYLARLLVGPNGGTITLATGVYGAWVKVAATPETVVLPCGELTVV